MSNHQDNMSEQMIDIQGIEAIDDQPPGKIEHVTFEKTIADWQHDVYKCAVEKGWWDEGERNVGELIMLCVTELAEAFEEHRNHHAMKEIYIKDGKPEGVPIEFADTIIRLLDIAGFFGINMESALRMKYAYNLTRPFKHGGKRF